MDYLDDFDIKFKILEDFGFKFANLKICDRVMEDIEKFHKDLHPSKLEIYLKLEEWKSSVQEDSDDSRAIHQSRWIMVWMG